MSDKTRTDSYQFSTIVRDGFTDERVEFLRSYCKKYNKIHGTHYYVKLQGRGPRNINGRKYHQSLPLKYAVTADVYVYQRNMY